MSTTSDTTEERLARRREAYRRYRERHKEQLAAKQKTPERRAQRRKAAMKWQLLHNDKYREYQRTYRLKNDTHRLQRRHQIIEAGRARPEQCDICGSTGRINFDHCHQRGVFRGYICHSCNLVLGHVKDDPNHLRKLIAYLERTKDIVPPQLSLAGIQHSAKRVDQ